MPARAPSASKGAPLWELERAIAGASQPLLRLAHTLARPVTERALMSVVASETVDLAGAVVVGTYVSGTIGIAPAAIAGPPGARVRGPRAAQRSPRSSGAPTASRRPSGLAAAS